MEGGHLPCGADGIGGQGRGGAGHEDLCRMGAEQVRAPFGGPRGRRPVVRVLREGLLQDLPQGCGHAAEVGLAGQDAEGDHVGRAGAEGEPAGRRVGDEGPQANTSPAGPAVPVR